MKIFIFIILFILIYSSSILKFPFKRVIPDSNNINPENFIDLLYYSNYYIELNIGSNNQKIPMRVSFDNYHSFITISNYTGNFKKYNPEQSTTYQKLYGERFFSLINIKKGIYSKETFTLYDINNKKVITENIKFVLATFPNVNISGEFGMSLSTKDEQYNELVEYNFIKNLHQNNYINHKIFFINFFNKNSGEILIGDYPDKYSNYDSNSLIKEYIPTDKNGFHWGMKDIVSKIKGKDLFIRPQIAEFSIEKYLIQPHSCYKEKIDELFFKEQIQANNCIFVNESYEYSFYHCDKNINLSNFPKLVFYQRTFNYSFELNSSDLFEDFGDRKYFLMNFIGNSEKWVLGHPFLKKYKFVYNFDSNTIEMYFKFKDSNDEKDENNFNKLWILVIICSIIIIILSIIIYILMKKFPRKKRVNELDEYFDYKDKEDIETNEKIINQSENKIGIND